MPNLTSSRTACSARGSLGAKGCVLTFTQPQFGPATQGADRFLLTMPSRPIRAVAASSLSASSKPSEKRSRSWSAPDSKWSSRSRRCSSGCGNLAIHLLRAIAESRLETIIRAMPVLRKLMPM